MASSPAFGLGAYFGNPNGNDATANAQWETQYNQLAQLMGVRPTFMDTYTDFGQDPSQWASNAGWGAWSFAQTGASYVGPTSGTTPVVGLPLASNAGGWGNVDTFYQGIISGQYDADYKGVVDAWAGQGYHTVQFRPAYEFNGNWMPWSPGNSGSSTANADFVKAFQHIADLIHQEGAAKGITAQVDWNISTGMGWNQIHGQSPLALYPGDQYVDIVSSDDYSNTYPSDLTNWSAPDASGKPTGTAPDQTTWAASATNREHFWNYPGGTQYNPTPSAANSAQISLQDLASFAEQHNKPLSISESGAGNTASGPQGPQDDPAFPQWEAGVLTAAEQQGLKVSNVNLWSLDYNGGDNFIGGERPQEAAAWAKYFGAGSGGSGSTGGGGGSGPGTLAATVSLTAATQGQALPSSTQIAAFSDTNTSDPASAFTASISWGDGATTAGTVTGSAGSFAVDAGHTYAAAGSDALSVTVTSSVANEAPATAKGNVAVASSGGGSGGAPTLLHASGTQFVDAGGNAVYLAGSHTWNDAQSYANQSQFTFQQFSDFEKSAVDANFIRYWMYNASNNGDATYPDSQLPFARSSTSGAADGNKWDLTKFNQSFFTQLGQNAQIASANGQYLDVMLFPGAASGTDPFTAGNNVQGVGNGSGFEYGGGTLSDPAVLQYQEAYIAKVLDTVGKDPNIVFEVANEGSASTVPWQETIVSFVHSYEQQHGLLPQMVGITPAPDWSMSTLEGSSADWIEAAGGNYDYAPPTAQSQGSKPVVVDDDHTGGAGLVGNPGWAWQLLTTGNSLAYMDDMNGSGLTDPVYANNGDANNRVPMRLAISETRQAAAQLKLTGMTPQASLSSTGYALADPSAGEYAVYAPHGGTFTVNLAGFSGALSATWYDVPTGHTQTASATGGSSQSFTSPFGGDQTGLVLTPASGGSGGSGGGSGPGTLAAAASLNAATQGQALPASTQVATFTDTNASDAASVFTAAITWGDGTTSAGTVTGSAGQFAVDAGHTYAAAGNDALSVKVTSSVANEAPASAAGTVVVAAAGGGGGTVIAIPDTQASATITQSNVTVQATGGNHILFLGGTGDTVHLTGGNDRIVETGSGNTFDLPASGLGADHFGGKILSNGDVLDLRAAMAATTWDGNAADVGSYLKVFVDKVGHLGLGLRDQPTATGHVIAAFHDYGTGTTLADVLAHSVLH